MKRSSSSAIPTWWANAILLIVGCTAGAAIWSLVIQNQMLRQALERRPVERPSTYESGEALPELPLTSLSGESRTIADITRSYNATVVAFLTTTCPFCRESLPVWERVHNELRANGGSVIGISLDPVEETQRYVEEHTIAWPTYVISDLRERSTVKVPAVPVTLAIAEKLTISGVWMGVLAAEDAPAILSATRLEANSVVSWPDSGYRR